MTHYDDVLSEARRKCELHANEWICELYNILTDEEKLEPEDARSKIEYDLADLYSKATIRKYLPPQIKDEKKARAAKIKAERQRMKQQLLSSKLQKARFVQDSILHNLTPLVKKSRNQGIFMTN